MLLQLVDLVLPIRVNVQAELDGLDKSLHNEAAFNSGKRDEELGFDCSMAGVSHEGGA